MAIKAKSRSDSASPSAIPPQNVMFDRRVCRGTTFKHRPSTAAGPEKKPPRRSKTRLEGEISDRPFSPDRAITPEPVPGRRHTQIQTKPYVEMLTDGSQNKPQAIQTDDLNDVPDLPLFIPKSLGESKYTEILPGEMFDFDSEVEPTVEVLVGKTIDLAMMDVIEETELLWMARHQSQFEQIRSVELAEMQRLEAREKRIDDEKHRRLTQQRERQRKEIQLAKKTAARTVAKHSLHSLETAVIDKLKSKGVLANPVAHEVEYGFMPWLTDETSIRVEQDQTAKELMADLSRDAIWREAISSQTILDERKELLAGIQQQRRMTHAPEQQVLSEIETVSDNIASHKEQDQE